MNGRYRNRVEFKEDFKRELFKDMMVDIETEWNLKNTATPFFLTASV